MGSRRGRRYRLTHAAGVLGLVAVLLAGGPPAQAQSEDPAPGAVLLEICSASLADIPELGGRLCASFEAGSTLLAGICGQLPIPPEACAAVTAGVVVDGSVIDAYEQSWVHRALRAQELLDRHEPLRNSLIPHTHNSSNANSYDPTLSTLDPNHRFSITDQLRMDIRGIELDLHWVPSPTGDGFQEVVLCHGESVDLEAVFVHVGCSIDMPLSDGLVEIRDFLRLPGNEEIVLLVYLENVLDDDPEAHARAVAALEEVLGDLVYRPDGGDGTCVDVPMDGSRQDVLDAGHQIVLVGNCGPGPWGGWVFERGPEWLEASLGPSGYPAYPDCVEGVRVDRDYDNNFIRHWEDLTWLSAMVNGDKWPMTPEITRAMVRCGVTMIGFDHLTPDDGRLEALVWSWAPGEPAVEDTLACAFRGDDGRFRMGTCEEPRPSSCRTGDGDWLVSDHVGPWSDGEQACAALGATFAVPPTGWENERLGMVAASVQGGMWIPIGRAEGSELGLADDAGSEATTLPSLPRTGGSPLLANLGLGVLVALGAVLARSRLSRETRAINHG